jgi:hypothetical protein
MTPDSPTGARAYVLAVRLTIAVLAGIVGFTALTGVVDRLALGWAAALAAAGMAVWSIGRLFPVRAAIAEATPVSRRLFIAGAGAVLGQLLVLTVFIIDPNVAVWPDTVWRPWQSRHSCVSAYWTAAVRAEEVPDLYLESVYRRPIAPTATRQPNLGPFFVDAYEYPPTFLPPVRLLRALAPDFWGFRRLWFALNLAGVAIGLVLIARRVDTRLGTQAIWLVPFALAAPAMIGTLQAGNVQLLFLVASCVAMWLFERGRPAAGGLLLGYAIASKLYPGMLLLYLLMRRDWRALGWTTAAVALLTAISLIDVGWTPMAAFLHHLPKILSGEAFPGLYRPPAIAINESIPGLVFKLGLFGVPGMDFGAARVVGWLYTVVVIGATVWLAQRRHDRAYDPLAWIAILIMATLRSPFLPGYGAFPSLWLATLVVAVVWRRRALRTVTLALWVVLAVSLGQNSVWPPLNAVVTLAHTLAALVLVFAVLPKVAPAPAPVLEGGGAATPVPA